MKQAILLISLVLGSVWVGFTLLGMVVGLLTSDYLWAFYFGSALGVIGGSLLTYGIITLRRK